MVLRRMAFSRRVLGGTSHIIHGPQDGVHRPPPLHCTIAMFLPSLILFLFCPRVVLAGPDSAAHATDDNLVILDFLSVPSTFKSVRISSCTAIAADETIVYRPFCGGIPDNSRIPASSFSVQGASCDAVEDADYQLSTEMPTNGSALKSLLADEGTGVLLYGKLYGELEADSEEGEALCQRNSEGDERLESQDATVSMFMIGSYDASHVGDFIPVVDEDSEYFFAAVKIMESSPLHQLCIFEAEELEGGSSTDENFPESEDESKLSKLGITRSVLATVVTAALAATMLVAIAR